MSDPINEQRCEHCGGQIELLDNGIDQWWVHAVHPLDGHDAAPSVSTDNDKLPIERAAQAIGRYSDDQWARWGTHTTSGLAAWEAADRGLRASGLIEENARISAELVGLRTEVDQLRTDNERLRAENDQLHEACRLLGAVNVAESQDVYAGWSAKLAVARAERDALQAKLEGADIAFAAAVERGQELIDQVAALQARIDAAYRKMVNGVDPLRPGDKVKDRCLEILRPLRALGTATCEICGQSAASEDEILHTDEDCFK